MDLPLTMVNYTSCKPLITCRCAVVNHAIAASSAAIKVVIIAIFSKYLGIAIPFVGVLVYFLQSFYLKTSRQIRLLGIEARAPLYAHFTESQSGAATIRAFGWQSQYQEQNFKLVDVSQQPSYLQSCIQTWLGFVLDIMVTVLAIVLVGTVITWHDKFSAGSVGVSLVMVVGFNTTVSRLIQTWTKLESSIGAVARVKRFSIGTDSEEDLGKAEAVPPEWPHSGSLEFENVVASYG